MYIIVCTKTNYKFLIKLIQNNKVHLCTLVLLILFTACNDLAASLNVSFSQSTYSVKEGDRLLQPTLILNSSLSTSFTMRVRDKSITATGKYIIIVTNVFIIIILQEKMLIINLDHTTSHFLLE